MTQQFFANMANGQSLCFNNLDFGDFAPAPFFRQLSFINRWAGNITHDYSVLQHSLLVAHAIDEPHLKIYGLLHDIPECATGDVTGPYKAFIDVWAGGRVETHETEMLNRLCEAVGIAPVDLTIGRKIYRADMVARATELRDVVLNPNGIKLAYDPLPQTIQPINREELIIQAQALYHTYLDLYHAEKPETRYG